MEVFVASRRGFDFETHLGVWQLAKTVVMHDDFGQALSAKNQNETVFAQSTPPAGVFECALSRGSIQWEQEETRTQHTCSAFIDVVANRSVTIGAHASVGVQQ